MRWSACLLSLSLFALALPVVAEETPAPRQAVFFSPFLGQPAGGTLSYEHAFGRRSSVQLFADYQGMGTYVYPSGRRIAGGLGLKRYFFTQQAFSGLFLGVHGQVQNTMDEMVFTATSTVLRELTRTFYGYGVDLGWAFSIGQRFKLVPGYRVDVNFSDLTKSGAEPYWLNEGRVTDHILVHLGYTF